MIITLKSKTTIAEIDTKGAFVISLVSSGRKILYPKSELKIDQNTTKTRGGMHVCLPNFGRSRDQRLVNHGFGRELEWEIVDKTSKSLELKLAGGNEEYLGLESIIRYELGEKYLKSSLTLSNVGTKGLPVAPGFHPYFSIAESDQTILLDGQRFKIDKTGDTKFVSSVDKLKIGKFIYDFDVINLNKFAIWTDGLADYICVEPTENGDAFLQNSATTLDSQEFKQYIFKFSWIYDN